MLCGFDAMVHPHTSLSLRQNILTSFNCPIVEVHGLSVGHGDLILLDTITFDVFSGEVFVILGSSGCGKSTLLKHLIGLIDPKAGDIRIAGQDLVAAEGAARRDILRSLGVAYQSGALFGYMTLLDNVRLPLEEFTALPDLAVDMVARFKLALVGLTGFERYLPSELSGGMKKRAAIARAMALDPQILFLDEPSAGLDPIASAGLDQLILQLRDILGMTFVIVSHELSSIYTIADRVILLDQRAKGILAKGRPQDLRDYSDDPRVRQFFLR
ncbi:intermembrane phospholipid transport system, ATP binding subunit MlaF [Desulfovibrionales bacterium]